VCRTPVTVVVASSTAAAVATATAAIAAGTDNSSSPETVPDQQPAHDALAATSINGEEPLSIAEQVATLQMMVDQSNLLQLQQINRFIISIPRLLLGALCRKTSIISREVSFLDKGIMNKQSETLEK
jgi:hypothetical protein